MENFNAILQLIYIVAALAGVLLYNYAGYVKFGKPKGEAYDYTKLLGTLMTGGSVSLVTSALTYVAFGFDVGYVMLAFINGLLFSAGIDQYGNIGAAKTVQSNAA